MKLEVGKSYVARNGKVHGPMRDDWQLELYNWHVKGGGYLWDGDGKNYFGELPDLDLIREHNPKPEGPTLTMSLDLSDMRNAMERLNRATKAFLEEYDRD